MKLSSLYKSNATQNRNRLRRHPTKSEIIVRKFLNELKLWYVFQKIFFLEYKSTQRNSCNYRIYDFYLRHRIGIEVDGEYHFKHLIERYDGKKDYLSSMSGIKTLRMTNNEVSNNSFKIKLCNFLLENFPINSKEYLKVKNYYKENKSILKENDLAPAPETNADKWEENKQ